MNSPAKALHSLVDFRRPVFADVGDDSGLPSTEHEPALDDRLMARVRPIQIYGTADYGPGRGTDCSTLGNADCNANRTGKRTEYCADAHANRCCEDGMGLLAIDLNLAQSSRWTTAVPCTVISAVSSSCQSAWRPL